VGGEGQFPRAKSALRFDGTKGKSIGKIEERQTSAIGDNKGTLRRKGRDGGVSIY